MSKFAYINLRQTKQMKKETTFRNPKTTFLLLFSMLFSICAFSQQSQSFAQSECGTILSIQFTNGIESIEIEDDGQYDLNELPPNFYIQLDVEGNSESARISVENLMTEERVAIVDNDEYYSFPSEDTAWNMGTGIFKLSNFSKFLSNSFW